MVCKFLVDELPMLYATTVTEFAVALPETAGRDVGLALVVWMATEDADATRVLTPPVIVTIVAVTTVIIEGAHQGAEALVVIAMIGMIVVTMTDVTIVVTTMTVTDATARIVATINETTIGVIWIVAMKGVLKVVLVTADAATQVVVSDHPRPVTV